MISSLKAIKIKQKPKIVIKYGDVLKTLILLEVWIGWVVHNHIEDEMGI